MNKEQKPEAHRLAEKLRGAINLLDCDFADDIDTNDLKLAAMELESLHARAAAPAQPQADALDAERWRFIRRKLCLSGNGDGTCAMQALNLPARILGWPDVGELAMAQFLDAAIDAAIAAAKGE